MKTKTDQQIKDIYIKAFKKANESKKSDKKSKTKKKPVEGADVSPSAKKAEPEDMQEKIDDLPKFEEEKLPDIIDTLARQLEEIRKDC